MRRRTGAGVAVGVNHPPLVDRHVPDGASEERGARRNRIPDRGVRRERAISVDENDLGFELFGGLGHDRGLSRRQPGDWYPEG